MKERLIELKNIDVNDMYQEYVDTYDNDIITLHLATLKSSFIYFIINQVARIMEGHINKVKNKIQDILNKKFQQSAAYEDKEMYKIACEINEDYFILLFESEIIEKLENTVDEFLNNNKSLSITDSIKNKLDVRFKSLEEYFNSYIDNDITDLIIERGNLNERRLKNEKGQNHDDEMKCCNKIISDIDDLNGKINLIFKFKIKRLSTKEIETRAPELFTARSGTLKIPDAPGNFTLETCVKEKWIKSTKKIKSSYLKTLVENGKSKSILAIKFQNLSSKNSIDTCIRILLDRNEKLVMAYYDEKEINLRKNEFLKAISDADTLYPVFISSVVRKSAIGDEPVKIHDPNLLLRNLCQTAESYKKLMIFLMIENDDISYYSELKKDEFEKVKEKFGLSNEARNPIITIVLQEKHLGIGRKRKIMMLLAEHFDFKNFYFIDDDIDSFYQYDDYERDHVQDPNQTFKALKYMSTVLDHSVNQVDENIKIDSQKCIDWGDDLASIKRALNRSDHESQCYKQLRELIQEKNFKDKATVFSLLSVLTKSELIDESQRNIIKEIEVEIKDKLYNKRLKTIGQIGLWNQNHYSQKRTLEDRLRSLSRSTHFVSTVRYQVVLYNLEAIKGIHHVSDSVLFEKPLNEKEKASLVQKSKNKELDNKESCEAARLGYKYDDNTHVLYQIVNGVTGFEVFNFSFKDKVNIPSKVNCDYTIYNLGLD